MGNIVLLDDLTINQIAAGEVIERPASVVKELVENSIDAGANVITVEVKNGGISYIRVSDNGKGIERDDLEIAFERHATSKIRQAEDLETVKTMGFRGEALASIAAIAKVEMMSKVKDAELGYRVVVEGGQILEKEETGCPQGTTIAVCNLFYNTPVRYKFLKKDYTESGYIEDAITRLALVHPEISFKLVNSGKVVMQTLGDGIRKNCIYSIYGKEIANNIIDVNYVYDGIIVDGVIGKPDIARNNRTQQLFFVNERFVKDKTLSSAIEQAYKGLLTIGKHAFCILNIKMDPSGVDVNVHPAKLEVRFKDENKIFKAIYHTVKENLLRTDLVREPEKSEIEQTSINNNANELVNEEDLKQKKSSIKVSNLFKRKDTSNSEYGNTNLVEQLYRQKNQNTAKIDNLVNKEEKVIERFNSFEEPKTVVNDVITIDNKHENVEENKFNFEKMYEKTFGKDLIKEEKESYNTDSEVEKNRIIPDVANVENISVFDETTYNEIPKYKFIGIAFSTYIILEIENELYILDQHAAHERIMYEKIKQNFYSNNEKESQLMLLPDVITVTHKEMLIVQENREMFEKAGFMIEEFGENTIKLTGVPNICMELDTKELFMEILDAIDTVAVTAIQEKEEKFIATIACKSAVKANMALDVQEVEALMNDLLKLPNPFTCPHGRPTAIKMTKMDIEKKFSRR